MRRKYCGRHLGYWHFSQVGPLVWDISAVATGTSLLYGKLRLFSTQYLSIQTDIHQIDVSSASQVICAHVLSKALAKRSYVLLWSSRLSLTIWRRRDSTRQHTQCIENPQRVRNAYLASFDVHDFDWRGLWYLNAVRKISYPLSCSALAKNADHTCLTTLFLRLYFRLGHRPTTPWSRLSARLSRQTQRRF